VVRRSAGLQERPYLADPVVQKAGVPPQGRATGISGKTALCQKKSLP
jgi:hypothetical protein